MKSQPTHTVSDARNFIMHQNIIRMSSHLNNEDLGQLVRYFFLYAENGQMPDEEQNLTIAIIFNEWRIQFESDKERYEVVSQKRREAGRKRWDKKHDSAQVGSVSPSSPSSSSSSSSSQSDKSTVATPMSNDDMATPSSPTVKAKKKSMGSPSRDLASRRTDFYQGILPYADQYDREMLNDFFQYWTELDKRRQRMRFEMQKTWETGKRLSLWERREIKK